jgi:hypothetical protein
MHKQKVKSDKAKVAAGFFDPTMRFLHAGLIGIVPEPAGSGERQF